MSPLSGQDVAPEQPLVSVVLIFLDGERFLREAIESVLAQTYRRWELLLVDDGSTDGSSAIAREYAARFSAVRYLEHEGHCNLGMSVARNLGIRHAAGEYIAFLDADDVYLPEKLERQVAILTRESRAAMVYGATLHWYSWTGEPADVHRDFTRKLGVPKDSLIDPPDLVRRFLRHEAWTPGTCGVLLRRAVIEQVGGFDESFRGMFEDQVFFYKICLTHSVFIESGSWDRYRQHPDSSCEVARRDGRWSPGRQPNAARKVFLHWLETYLDRQGMREPVLLSELRRELFPYKHPLAYRLATNAKRLGRWVLTPAGKQ
jgi:glycosyltransferase involved in cell wall biosynthesis